ncbi:sensor domain-containing protein [Mycobacterium koreense]|nr:sensor domain-containing protein [Mycolicibacillus koreensis]MCV7247215.1 sensor domain-containing protein [Mycolicibacillus koreensis]ODR04038.1 hypothetical protein BHQ15_17615 [Mycolicibacillus koreensis]
MRRRMAALISAGLCLVTAACGGAGDTDDSEPTTTSTTTSTARPLAEGALDDLLLDTEQINAIMGAEEMAVTRNRVAMSDDADTMEPRECLAVDGAAQAQVYADSGFAAVRDLTFAESDNFEHYAQESVVMFTGAKQSKAFFEASTKQWPECREYIHTQSGTEWTPGPITTDNGVMSLITIQQNGPPEGWACGRALAVRNNIIIDVNTCSAKPGESATKIATQIADKVRVT